MIRFGSRRLLFRRLRFPGLYALNWNRACTIGVSRIDPSLIQLD
jgi:hypothetical protein